MFRILKKIPSRLRQWNGRRRSSRSSETVLPRFWERSVLTRLAVVWLTTMAVTLVAYGWGLPCPYRVGQTLPHDLRVRVDFEVVNHVALVNQEPSPKDVQDSVLEKARFTDRPVVERYPRGMVLVPRGRPIVGRQLGLLKQEHLAYERSMRGVDHWQRGLALFLIFSLLAALVVLYVARFQVGLAQSLPTIAGVCTLVLVTLVLAMFLSAPPWHACFIPLTMTAMVLTIVYNPQFALLMSFSLSLAVTVALGKDLMVLLELMGGLAAVVLLLRNIRTRTQLVKVGLGAGCAFLLMTVATGLLSWQSRSLIVADAFRHFLWGTLAGFLMTGLLPVVERCFGIVTDISLLELADGAHPLLQELVRRAPGTYTHSITVATLAEAAAEAIDANPLLTRVGSYYHDIGKMLKPHYFIENQTGQNLHDSLEPALSTLVILGHVKDGVALGRQYRLPRPILDFIAQHHGTTLVEYFYREAMRLHEDAGQDGAELEASFRYPGPKPKTPEAGIIMLADAVESSSRSLQHFTPGSVSKLVHDLVMKRLLDGQFEESSLTLTQLHRIEESLCKSLIAMFHARIKYPDPPQIKAA
ncbi:MAG TPA: HDIG domain-containing protein [Gemmataceae bacterium]|nr:HDIG domain-containing protein [Gemmataceae bacterium]